MGKASKRKAGDAPAATPDEAPDTKKRKKGVALAGEESKDAAPASGAGGVPKLGKKRKRDAPAKGAPGAAGAAKDAPADIEALRAEANAAILKGIADPKMQTGRKAFIPKEWKDKYKPTLGTYKRFVSSQADKFRIIEYDSCSFVIKSADDPKLEPEAAQAGWKKMLTKAWLAYCHAVPGDKRSVAEFQAGVPTQLDKATATAAAGGAVDTGAGKEKGSKGAAGKITPKGKVKKKASGSKEPGAEEPMVNGVEAKHKVKKVRKKRRTSE